ncbi:MAG: hypothetical protein H6828_08590 [Planctomycetes bacterium]|nr:hypothetical protein [Planctomycetota bacterium]
MPAASSSRRTLLLVLGLALAVKAALVLSLADVFFYGEELEKGTAAKAMLDGLAVPHHQLAYHYYEGGGFVASHLAAVAFLLVGPCLLAHKLVTLAWGLAIVAAGWRFARALFGAGAAALFATLLVLAPEAFQKLALIDLGIHHEALLFAFGVLGLGWRLAFGEARPRREWFALGLVTGFGLYFSYQVALAAAWVLVVLCVRRPRGVLGAGGALGLVGTLLGATPLLLMYALVGERVFDIHGAAIAGDAAAPAKSELLGAFARSVFVDASAGHLVSAWSWLVASLVAPLWLLRDGPGAAAARRGLVYAGGYLALFLAAYLGTGFVQGEVFHFFLLLRLAPLWCFATLLVAAGVARAWSGGARLRWAASALAALLLAGGAAGTLRAVRAGSPTTLGANWRTLVETKGYDYDQYFAKVLWHFDGDLAEKLDLVEGFDEPARDWLRADAAGNLWREEGRGDPAGALGRALASVAAYAPERRQSYWLGLGPTLVIACGWDAGRALSLVRQDAPPRRLVLLEALGRFGAGGHPLDAQVTREVARGADLAPAERAAYLRGLGRWLHKRFRVHPARAEAYCASLPAEVGAALLEGYRRELAWHRLPE